ncbi:hypothetical protein WN943_009516 [Citrus x changshan-huyou]
MRIHDDIDPAIMSRCGGYTGMEANQALGLSYHAIRVANGPDGTRHGMCPYSTARHEHVSVEHAARHGTYVGRAGLRF